MKVHYNGMVQTKLQSKSSTAAFEAAASVNTEYKKRVAKAKKRMDETKTRANWFVDWLEIHAKDQKADLRSAAAVEECLLAIRSAGSYSRQTLVYIAMVVLGTVFFWFLVANSDDGVPSSV
jgi:hypothetical protein